ncbi:MAG: DUF58 domain-containing protein [Acidobacteriaceae bacterium]|nr:DUF58 domain-containing protein [Acidobacteriaceae bacterium]
MPYALLPLLAAAAAFDALRGTRSLAAITVTAGSPLKWFRGRQSIVSLSLHSEQTRTGHLKLSLDLPESITPVAPVATVRPRADGTVDIACVPNQRGRFSISVCYIAGLSPWQLWHARSPKSIDCEIRVFPDLERETGAKPLFFKKPGGLRPQRQLGRGREFERLREYAHGDSFDEIYWKATARRGKPIVKVFQVERTQDVYAVVDSSRLAAKNSATDRFVSAALMLALAAENHGDNFGLVTFSDRVHDFVPASRGKGHFSRCREAIYDLEARRVSPDFEELFTFLQLRIRKRSLLLFLTDLGDPMLAEMFVRNSRMLARRHVVLVSRLENDYARPLFSGPTPQTAEDICLRLAGHLQWAAFKDLEKNLHRLGIGVHSLRPEAAGIDLVQQYVEVKRRQAL